MEGQCCIASRVAGLAVGAALAGVLAYLFWSGRAESPAPRREALGTVPATKSVGQRGRATRPISEDLLPLAELPWAQARNTASPLEAPVRDLAQTPWKAGRKNIIDLAGPNSELIKSSHGNNYRIGSSSQVELARLPWSRSTTRLEPARVETARVPKDFETKK